VLALHLLASSLFHSVKRQTVQIRLRTHVRHRGLMPFGLRLLLSSLEVMPLRPPSALPAQCLVCRRLTAAKSFPKSFTELLKFLDPEYPSIASRNIQFRRS